MAIELQDGRNLTWFDANSDGDVDLADRRFWITNLAQTWFGDSNLDDEFGSSDLVLVFQATKYERDIDASWSEGDWDGDGRFNTKDLVVAFQEGGYERGPRNAVNNVPEPSAAILLLLGIVALLGARPKKPSHQSFAALASCSIA